MAIRIAPGTFAGGTRFADIALPMAAQALAGMFAGKRLGEQETYERSQKAQELAEKKADKQRAQAIADMSALIEIHGPEVVNMPNFQEKYRSIFGRDYPTSPVMREEVVTPEVPGQPSTPARIMQVPGTSPAERGPGGAQPIGAPSDVTIPGRPAVAPTPAVTRQVPTGATAPVPLGGRYANITPRQLGMEGFVPPKLLDVPLPQLKQMGFDVSDLLKGGKTGNLTSDHVVAQALQAFREGRATQADMAVLELKYSGESGGPPRTPEAYAVMRLRQVGGDMEKLRQVDPYSYQILSKAAETAGEKGVLFTIRGPNGQRIPIKGMDDLKALVSAGIVSMNDLPPIARNMFNLDKEGRDKGIPAGAINTALNQAGNEAAKILGIFTVAGTWAWQSDEGTPERAVEVKRWEDLRDKIYRDRINRMRSESDAGVAEPTGDDPDDPGQAGPITLHGSLQYLSNQKQIGGISYKVTSTTSDQHVANSAHYQGHAIDIVPEIPINQWDRAIREIQKQGYKVIDERVKPKGAAGKYWTGPHLHIEPGSVMMRQGRELDTTGRVAIVKAAQDPQFSWQDIEQSLQAKGYNAKAIQIARKIFDDARKPKPTTPPATQQRSPNTIFNIPGFGPRG